MAFFKDFLKKFKQNETKTKKSDQYFTPCNPMDVWDNIGEIGDGAFGKVYKGKKKTDETLAALKQVELEEEGDLEEYIIEIEILTECKHQNIINLYAAYNFESKLWMALEYCNGGALDSLMLSLDKGLTEPAIKYAGKEVLNGLIFLHQHKIIHRDMKAGNVLVTKDAEVKLADFGVSAKMTADRMKRNTVQGTPYWMAPEVISCQHSDSFYDTKADVWSYGITLIELAQMRPPYHSMQPNRVLLKITKSDPPTLDFPNKWSSVFNDFLSKCLVKDQAQRPYSAELINEKFLSEVNDSDKRALKVLIYEAKAESIEETVEEMEDESVIDDGDLQETSSMSSTDVISTTEKVTTPDRKMTPMKISSKEFDEKTKTKIANEILDDIISSQITSEDDDVSVCGVVLDVMQELNPVTSIDDTAEQMKKEKTKPKISNVLRQDSMRQAMDETNLEIVEIDDSIINKGDIKSDKSSKIDNVEQTSSNTEPKFERKKSHYRTMTRKKTFVVDGEQMTTIDKRVVVAGQETKQVDDINDRRNVLRGMKQLGKLESRQNRQKAFKVDNEKIELQTRLKFEEQTLERNYEIDMEKLMKEHKGKLEKLENEQQNELRNIQRKILAENNKKEEDYKKEDKNQFNKQLQSLTSKQKRKDNLKRLKDSHNTVFQSKLQKLSEELNESMNSKLIEVSKENRKQIFELEKKQLDERIFRRKTYDSDITKKQYNDSEAIYQLDRAHNKEWFTMRRLQMKNRQDKEIELLERDNKKEIDELEAIQAGERRNIPRQIKNITKIRIEQKRKELEILMEKKIITNEDFKSRFKQFTEAEKEREKKDMVRNNKKLDRIKEDMRVEHMHRRRETDAIHSDQKKELTDKENEEERDLRERSMKRKKELDISADVRRKETEKCYNEELERLKSFYCPYEGPNGMISEYSDNLVQQTNNLGFNTYFVEQKY